MLEVFKITFATGLGLIASIVVFALVVGLWESLGNAVRLARMRQKVKRRLKD
jgi:flagellar biosynthesis protein FliQ